MPHVIRKDLGDGLKAPLVFTDHHESHAASAFFPSPFDEAAILTLDGVGEWSTTTMGVGRGNQIALTRQISVPALARAAVLRVHLLLRLQGEQRRVQADGPGAVRAARSTRISSRSTCIDLQDRRQLLAGHGVLQLLPGPDDDERSVSRSVRRPAAATRDRPSSSGTWIWRRAFRRSPKMRCSRWGARSSAQTGHAAASCWPAAWRSTASRNGRLLREGPFDDIWIQPAAGDAGGALGAALFAWHQLLEQAAAVARRTDTQKGSLLGPRFDTTDVCAFLDGDGREVPPRLERGGTARRRVATCWPTEKIVGWFQGRMEFGPRALGARSILGDPRSPKMQATMNLKIKFRESFRPFAPCVLAGRGARWFDLEPGQESPYMLLVAPVPSRAPRRRSPTSSARSMASDPDLRNRVNIPRSDDSRGHARRLQRASPDRRCRPQPALCTALLQAFYRRTGCPVLVNTSFNVRGEPIVLHPGGRLSLLACDRDGRARARGRDPAQGRRGRDRRRHDAGAYLAQFQLD